MRKPELKFAIIATDSVIFTILNEKLKILLVPVNIPPYFHDMQGLPGGLIAPDETAEDSVFRHIRNKTGLDIGYIEQLSTFSAINRDPRGRVVSVAYTACLSEEQATKSILKDGAVWVDVRSLPKLAYDHNEIVNKALENLRAKIWHTKFVQSLLPSKFTLHEIQSVFDVILGVGSDKRNFRTKVFNLDILKKVPGKKMKGAHRPAELYSFKASKVL